VHCFGLCIRKGLEPNTDRTVIILGCAIFEVAVYFVSTFAQEFQKELLIWHIGPLHMSFFSKSVRCLVTKTKKNPLYLHVLGVQFLLYLIFLDFTVMYTN
jgi:hypothetical protein